MFTFVDFRQKRNMRIIHQIMHFPVFRCFYLRFLCSVGISSMLGGGYAQIYMKTRGLRASECCLHFSTHFAVFCFRLTLQIRGALARRQLQNEACEIAKKCSTHQCQSNAPIFDDIHGYLHTIRIPWKCWILGIGGGLRGLKGLERLTFNRSFYYWFYISTSHPLFMSRSSNH